MTAACDVPCVNNRAASNRRASNAALRRCPCCGVVMPQHRMVPDDNHHFISRDSLVAVRLKPRLILLAVPAPVHHPEPLGGIPTAHARGSRSGVEVQDEVTRTS